MNDKILITSDWHIGEHGSFYRKGVNLRLWDIIKSLNFILQYTIDNEIKYIIIGGDIFKTRHPNSNELSIFYKFIKQLRDNNTQCHIVIGNHDYINGNLNVITPLLKLNLDNVFVYDKIGDIQIKGYKILAIPYNKLNEVQEIKDKSDNYELIVGHLGLHDLLGFENSLTYEDYFFEKSKQLILLGHYHGFTKVKQNCYFIGDIVQLTFAEAGQKKYFCVYQSPKKYEFIEIPTRQLIDIEINDVRGLNKLDVPKRSIVRAIAKEKIDREIIVDYCVKNKLYLQSINYIEKDNGEEVKIDKKIRVKNNEALLKGYLKTIGKENLLNACTNLIEGR